MKHHEISLLPLAIVFFTALTLSSQKNSELLNLDSNATAIGGYDPVSYFTLEKAIKGKESITSMHNGATYFFSTEENKITFEKTPEKFIPQYGGWCAYAMGLKAKKIAINPEAFTIEDGKLYLFYKTRWNDTRRKWVSNNEVLKIKADHNWQSILDEK